MKKRYISLMSKALDAYTDGHIKDYFDRVKGKDLQSTDFPDLRRIWEYLFRTVSEQSLRICFWK